MATATSVIHASFLGVSLLMSQANCWRRASRTPWLRGRGTNDRIPCKSTWWKKGKMKCQLILTLKRPPVRKHARLSPEQYDYPPTGPQYQYIKLLQNMVFGFLNIRQGLFIISIRILLHGASSLCLYLNHMPRCSKCVSTYRCEHVHTYRSIGRTYQRT